MTSLLAHVTQQEYPLGLALFLGGLGIGLGLGAALAAAHYFRKK